MYIDTENTQAKTQHRDSHPLSSLSTRHINMGKEEAHKLCVIEYDSMTHTNARIHSGDLMVTLDRWSVYSLSR